jgi:6,7-dimethyl-8-ribityllumazine synthase
MTDFFRVHFVTKGREAAEAVHQVLALDARLAGAERLKSA